MKILFLSGWGSAVPLAMHCEDSAFSTVNNRPNMRLVNAVFLCQYRAWSFVSNIGELSYLFNLDFGKNYVIFSSTFRNTISYILQLCSKPKMFWFYARRIIAPMKYVKTFWYFSILNNPRNAMSASPINRVKSSVALCLCTNPKPTVRSFLNVAEEAFGKIISHLKVLLSGVMPPDAQTSRRLFTEVIIA